MNHSKKPSGYPKRHSMDLGTFEDSFQLETQLRPAVKIALSLTILTNFKLCMCNQSVQLTIDPKLVKSAFLNLLGELIMICSEKELLDLYERLVVAYTKVQVTSILSEISSRE